MAYRFQEVADSDTIFYCCVRPDSAEKSGHLLTLLCKAYGVSPRPVIVDPITPTSSACLDGVRRTRTHDRCLRMTRSTALHQCT
jgi:hypothetical protein